MTSGQRFITIYNKEQCHGGPEEGGWWYYVYEADTSKKYSSNKTARREQIRLIKLYSKESVSVLVESKKELGNLDNTKERAPIYE